MTRSQFATGALLSCVVAGLLRAQVPDTSLVGLWYAKRWNGPEVHGELRIVRTRAVWQASIGSRTTPAHVAPDSVYFNLPSAGTFRGRLARNGASIAGHWVQPVTMLTGRRHVTPVVLVACGADCYSGNVEPLIDAFTFYMEVKPGSNGKLGAFLRNPERNQGRFIGLNHVIRRGDRVFLRNARDSTIATGRIQFGRLSVMFRGATFDFQKVAADSFTYFYPTGRPTGTYTYAAPRARNDGWSVASAAEVGMSAEKLAAMVRGIINASADSANAHRLHGILIARHGKLLLEEYFFGEHADKPHETRSASKTVLPVVMGAAIHAGFNVSPETPVYTTLRSAITGLDPRRRAMRLRHLLTMSSGLDCDDNGDPRPGNEDILTEQDTNPDWTRMIMGLQLLRDPGERAVYCSINSYLGGEVLRAATGRWLPELIWELVAAPLQMGRYHVQLSPLGEAYLGGGVYFLPRDFMKLAQLYANGGTWNGRRIVSEAWIRESVQPRYAMGPAPNYGYQWWTTTYPFEGRQVSAHFASGNGGQYAMFFPELGLVVAAFGGNYADRGNFATLRQLIPQHVLPAIGPGK